MTMVKKILLIVFIALCLTNIVYAVSMEANITLEDKLLENATISIIDSSSKEYILTSDKQGSFSIDNVAEGESKIKILSPAGLAIVAINDLPTDNSKSASFNINANTKLKLLTLQSINIQGKIIGGIANEIVSVATPHDNYKANIDADGNYYILDILDKEFTAYVKIPVNATIKSPSDWKVSNTGDLAWITQTISSGTTYTIPDLVFESDVRIAGNTVLGTSAEALQGANITLQVNNSGEWADIATVTSNQQGYFEFNNIKQGQYRLKLYDANNVVATSYNNADFTLQEDGSRTSDIIDVSQNVDILYSRTSSLVVSAFIDENNNGARGKYEVYVPGVKVEIIDQNGKLIAQGTTQNKVTQINGITPGNNSIRFIAPNTYWFAKKTSEFGGDFSCTDLVENNVTTSNAINFVEGQTVYTSTGLFPTSSMSGKAWLDSNNNGIMESDELGFEGLTIKAVSNKTGKEYVYQSDKNGNWFIPQIKAGNYKLSVELPENYLFAIYSREGRDLRSIFTPYIGSSAERDITLGNAQKLSNLNIGLIKPGSLSGKAFLDTNYNGVYDQGEPAVPGVVLELIRDTVNKSIGQVQSDENGKFVFPAVRQNEYRLRAITPVEGYEFTKVADGDISVANKFAQLSNRRENSLNPLNISNNDNLEVVVGFAKKQEIGGKIYNDDNFNGVYDVGEKLIQNIKIRVEDNNGNIIFNTTTNARGEYRIDGLYNGSIKIYMQSPKGYVFVRKLQNDQNSYIADIVNGEAVTDEIEIVMGENNTKINAGLILSGNIAGKLFEDANDNGMFDENESGFESATVELLDNNDALLFNTKTDNNGDYNFEGLVPGTYKLKYTLPNNCIFASQTNGGNSFAGESQTYTSEAFNFKVGENVQAPLGGAIKLASLKSTIFHDANANGILDSGENSMNGVEVKLSSENSNQKELIATTANNGELVFESLRPGNYNLSIKLPEGFIFSNSTNHFKWPRENEYTLAFEQNILLTNNELNIAAVKPCIIEATAWLDENMDGKHNDGENMFESAVFKLKSSNFDNEVVFEQASDVHGKVSMANVRPGKYEIQILLPKGAFGAKGNSQFEEISLDDGTKVLSMKDINIAQDEVISNISAGIISYMSLSGTVWLDKQGEKIYQANLPIEVYDSSNNLINSTQTNDNGEYIFENLSPGNYYLLVNAVEGQLFAQANDENFNDTPSVIKSIESNAKGKSETITISMPNSLNNKNIAFVMPAKLGDYVWLDANINGLYDEGEQPISNINISLMKENEVVYNTQSDGNGYYLLKDVYPGKYTLRADLPEAFTITAKNTDLPFISSCLEDSDANYGYKHDIIVKSAEKHFNADIGLALKPGYSIPANINSLQMQDWSQQEVHTNKGWER